MYLAGVINGVLDSKKHLLCGTVSYKHITKTLNRAFCRKEAFKFKYELYEEYGENDFSVSGLYDMSDDVRYVILNFPKNFETININERRWKEFRFAVSQVCQHEALHKLQWLHRDDVDEEREPLEFRCENNTREEEQGYLNNSDEIDAYAHDIAMEIMFFYPKKRPYDVLRSLSKYNKIWSYRYYKKTFRGSDWSQIRNRLLKKTYQWIPHTIV